LVLGGEGGEVRFQKPVVYQLTGGHDPTRTSDGVRDAIDGRYVVAGKNRVSFELAAYDRSKPLVIDPVLSYSTYLGGSGNDLANGIALDSAGNAYVTGQTRRDTGNSKAAPQEIGAQCIHSTFGLWRSDPVSIEKSSHCPLRLLIAGSQTYCASPKTRATCI
jgi:hypothetical protein